MCQYTSILAGLAALLVTSACRPQAPTTQAASANSEIVITHVAVVDPTSDRIARDMTVTIRGRLIRSVETSSATRPTSSARVIDGTGKYLIPGLWDMHVHTLIDGRAWALTEYVKHGITSVRDMGGQFEAVDSLRRDIAAGHIVGPRVLAGGPMIEDAAAMKYLLGNGNIDDSVRANLDRLELLTPAAATRGVDSLARLGVDFIKARDFADVPTYWAIANAARRAGKPFVAHPPVGIDPIALADSGQRSVEHWVYPNDLLTMPSAEHDRLVAAYVQHGTAFVPTMEAWRQHRLTADSLERLLTATLADPRAEHVRGALLRHWQTELASRRTEIQGKPATQEQLGGWNRVLDSYGREIGKLANAGVTILAASDLPFAAYPGDGLHKELRLLVRESGLTPRHALFAATVAPARFVGMTDSLGTIAVGKLADLVLLDADPFADIDNVKRVAAVMQGGRLTWTRDQQLEGSTR